MAIRVPNLGLGDGKTGDTELKIRQDYNHNFNDQTNAASRLVGIAAGQVPLAQYISGLSYSALGMTLGTKDLDIVPIGQVDFIAKGNLTNEASMPPVSAQYARLVTSSQNEQGVFARQDAYDIYNNNSYSRIKQSGYPWGAWVTHYNSGNTTKDSNGFLKGASPVIDLYSEHIDLNADATEQGGITFEKLGVGDYLVKGSLGFAQEGWYIETPKDANGNVLVAVVYEQLANNDLSIKTYAKRFDDETGDIVANLLKPRDIPVGRFISLRLHELPKEPPVMPTETQPEV